jgi:hypothetical protein
MKRMGIVRAVVPDHHGLRCLYVEWRNEPNESLMPEDDLDRVEDPPPAAAVVIRSTAAISGPKRGRLACS